MSCFHTCILDRADHVDAGVIGKAASRRVGRRVASAFTAAVLTAAALLPGCGKSNPADPGGVAYGSIVIRGRVDAPGLAKIAAASGFGAVADAQETKPTKLIIQIAGAGFDTIRVEKSADFSRPSVGDTVPKIPAGKNRRVSIWATDQNGVLTHIDSLESHAVDIVADAVTPVYATLIPAAGSIYLLFNGLAASVDSVRAAFKKADGTVVAESRVKKAVKTFLTLDNIPHLTAGILRVEIIGTSGDVLYFANKELTFNARGDNNIDLRFTAPDGTAVINIDLRVAGVTMGAYDFDNNESAVEESGELVITEIMWNASNDNYIELYNPGNTVLSFDTLITDVDGKAYRFANVNVAAKGFLVIGRHNQAHNDIYTATPNDLPITTTGNWIAVRRKNGAVIDRVICPGANSALGWPSVSGKRSVELARDKYNAADNNYGKNWKATTADMFNITLSLYGTPRAGADF